MVRAQVGSARNGDVDAQTVQQTGVYSVYSVLCIMNIFLHRCIRMIICYCKRIFILLVCKAGRALKFTRICTYTIL